MQVGVFRGLNCWCRVGYVEVVLICLLYAWGGGDLAGLGQGRLGFQAVFPDGSS